MIEVIVQRNRRKDKRKCRKKTFSPGVVRPGKSRAAAPEKKPAVSGGPLG